MNARLPSTSFLVQLAVSVAVFGTMLMTEAIWHRDLAHILFASLWFIGALVLMVASAVHRRALQAIDQSDDGPS